MIKTRFNKVQLIRQQKNNLPINRNKKIRFCLKF